MPRKCVRPFLVILLALTGCDMDQSSSSQASLPITGTWELISAESIEKDTAFSTFDSSHKMIKIINPTHFAFLNHDISGKDSSAASMSAGGGKYTLADSVYTEYLEYFTDRKWENNKFPFVVKIVGDTLIQKGVEKIEKLGIDHVIIEKYRRVKK